MTNHGCISNPCLVCNPPTEPTPSAEWTIGQNYMWIDAEPTSCPCECHKPKPRVDWTALDEDPAASAQMIAWHAPETLAALLEAAHQPKHKARPPHPLTQIGRTNG